MVNPFYMAKCQLLPETAVRRNCHDNVSLVSRGAELIIDPFDLNGNIVRAAKYGIEIVKWCFLDIGRQMRVNAKRFRGR